MSRNSAEQIKDRKKNLKQYLEDHPDVCKQDIIKDALHYGSQSTLSRDIKDIHAEKIKDSNGSQSYIVLSSTKVPKESREIMKVVKMEVIEAMFPCTTFVIKTKPGYAKSVARAVEKAYKDKVLGTISGDDLVIIAVTEAKFASEVSTDINNYLKR